MTAAALWTAVVAAYPNQALVDLTNLDNRAATVVDTTFGETAAQAAIDLWPLYAQTAYDANDATHVEVGILATIAVLNRRGGTSTQVEKITWDEVFGGDGMLEKLKRTGPRARISPVASGNSQRSSEGTTSGAPERPWSDQDARPYGISPSARSANEDED